MNSETNSPEYFIDYLTNGNYGLMKTNKGNRVSILAVSKSPSELLQHVSPKGMMNLDKNWNYSDVHVSPIVSDIIDTENIVSNKKKQYTNHLVDDENEEMINIIENIINSFININKKKFK